MQILNSSELKRKLPSLNTSNIVNEPELTREKQLRQRSANFNEKLLDLQDEQKIKDEIQQNEIDA